MVFPSGEEVRVSTRTLKPADGAISSLSIESNKAVWRSSAASTAGEFSCASNSSRLETFGFSTGAGMAAKNFLMRGSRRGSVSVFEVVLAFAGAVVFAALSPESWGAFSGVWFGMSVPFWLRVNLRVWASDLRCGDPPASWWLALTEPPRKYNLVRWLSLNAEKYV